MRRCSTIRARVSARTAAPAPGDIREERRLRLAHPKKYVTATLGGNENNIIAITQCHGGAAKMGLGQCRAVGADHQNWSGAGSHRRKHPGAEVARRLRPEGNLHPRDHFQKCVVRGIRVAAQRDRADAGSERGRDCALSQSLLQHCCGMCSNCRNEPSLGEARDRRLRQNRNRDRTSVRRGHSVARVASDQREEIRQAEPTHQEG